MLLPKLKVLKDAPDVKLSTCQGHDNCSDCRLYEKNDGICSGCTSQVRNGLDENFQACYKECHTCAGYRTKVTAICCRSPLKDIYLTSLAQGPDWNHPVFEFKERPLLSFKQKAVVNFIFGSAERICGEKHQFMVPPDTEVVATSLSFVKGMGENFYSRDLKGYMRVPKDTKLILTTMSVDDHLERAWDGERYGGKEYTKVGIDYWMPLAFSTYGGEARMHHYYQFLRTMRSMEWGRAHFVPGSFPYGHLKLDHYWKQAVEAVPNVMFNTQFMTTDDDIKATVLQAKWWHNLAPKGVGFWFVGATTPTALLNLRKVCPNRDVYWISGKPLYMAVNGKKLLPSGNEQKVDSSNTKYELLQENLATFDAMVKRYGL